MKKQKEYKQRIDGHEINFPLVDHMGTALTSQASWHQAHAHAGHELYFVINGEATFELEDESIFTVNGGEFSHLPPQITHHGRADHMAPCLWCWLVVTPEALQTTRNSTFAPDELNLLQDLFRNKSHSVLPCSTNIKNTIHRFRMTVAEYSAKPSPMLAVLLRAIACELIVQCALQLNAAPSHPDSIYGEAAVAFIEENLFKQITIPDIARHLGFSVSRTYALFRQHTGQSPNYYILSHRLKVAEKLLAEGSDSVTRIALQCGFCSSQYFSRMFKKFNGMTPSEFRRSLR